MYTKPSLGTGFAGVCAQAVAAGIIASSNGRASTAFALPFRNVRRGNAFLVMIIIFSFLVRIGPHPHARAVAYAPDRETLDDLLSARSAFGTEHSLQSLKLVTRNDIGPSPHL